MIKPSGYYFHFYRDGELVVAFKDRVFRITPDKSTWNEAVSYGRDKGTPNEQLDFYPSRLEEETY